MDIAQEKERFKHNCVHPLWIFCSTFICRLLLIDFVDVAKEALDRCVRIDREMGKEAVTFDYAYLVSSDDVEFGVGGARGERQQTSLGKLDSVDGTEQR